MRRFLQGAVADHGRRLSEVSLLGDTERESLLGEWAGTRTGGPRTARSRDRRGPGRPDPGRARLVAGEPSLTYAELTGRANRLAHRLRDAGVGPDALVGVCLTQSVDLAVAMLGVLKAGGAYVPLDPEQPQARLDVHARRRRRRSLVPDDARARWPPHRLAPTRRR